MNDYGDLVSYAIIFQRQIRRIKDESLGTDWMWENYIEGPISSEDAELIMGIAGCWCEETTNKSVRFYTNQNHPSWLRERQLLL